jgi:hypothetical protein
MMVTDTQTKRPSAAALVAYLNAPDTLAEQEREQIEQHLAALRRENVTRPVIYVGAGTCGLGAGAAKTL